MEGSRFVGRSQRLCRLPFASGWLLLQLQILMLLFSLVCRLPNNVCHDIVMMLCMHVETTK